MPRPDHCWAVVLGPTTDAVADAVDLTQLIRREAVLCQPPLQSRRAC